MASTTEFSRTLSLLRQERGVSQRTAAGALPQGIWESPRPC